MCLIFPIFHLYDFLTIFRNPDRSLNGHKTSLSIKRIRSRYLREDTRYGKKDLLSDTTPCKKERTLKIKDRKNT